MMRSPAVAAAVVGSVVAAAACAPEATTEAACGPLACGAADTGLLALPDVDMDIVRSPVVRSRARLSAEASTAVPPTAQPLARRRWEPMATTTATTTAAAATTATATTSARTSISTSIDEVERRRTATVRRPPSLTFARATPRSCRRDQGEVAPESQAPRHGPNVFPIRPGLA